ISLRGTCIVGVAATFDPRSVARLRGPLRLTLEAGGREASLRAVATPFMAVRDSLVFRRSEQRHGRTFAYSSGGSARDLDRALVAALQDPDAELHVTLEELSAESGRALGGCLMILLEGRNDELSPAARSFVEAADLLAAPDPAKLGPWGRSFGPTARLKCSRQSEAQEVSDALEEGRRVVLAIEPDDLHPDSASLELIRVLADRGIARTCIGAAPSFLRALVLSGCPASTFALLNDVSTVSLRRDLASPTLRRSSMVLAVSAAELPKRLVSLAEAGEESVFALRDPGGEKEEAFQGPPGELAEGLPLRRGDRSPWVLVVAPRKMGTQPEEGSLPTALLGRLLEAGIPLKTLAEAATRELGGSYRTAYRRLLELRRTLEESPDEDPGR
ncbi:MAG: DUF371 domain-containing protein, partial [Acidobacteria bacterium]|nr:DUF371 domain-containing protein [Acidobacteriota bacterium]